ncbi:MAG: hypothetical protein ACOC1D_02905 [Prolixibacteraceae bacterium]
MPEIVRKYGAVILLAIIIFGCNRKDNDGSDVIAEVGEIQLHLSEIAHVLPDDLEKEDSISMAQDYINKWIKRQLLIQKAEENLSVDQKDLSKELEEYRNSLIIYRYKNELMKQRMDTTVSEAQILEYYNANKENFKLSKNIVKAIFVKTPEEFAEPEQLIKWCTNPAEEDIIELRDYCIQYAKNYAFFTDNWVDFGLVAKSIPQQINNPEEFLKQNNRIELTEDGYYYLVSIQDYKLKNELAPVEFVADNIKNLIINKRKIEFLKEVENNVYTEGIRKNKFKINKRETNETE